MKIVLTSVGTQGDIEPFIAIGELLHKNGHQVICAFPEQFEKLATDADLEFRSLGAKFIELLNSKEGKGAMGGASGFAKFIATLKLAFKQGAANKELLIYQREIIDMEKPDRVVYNGKAIYPIIWHILTGGKVVFVSPIPYMHYVKGNTHIAFNSDYGEFFNKLTFSLANFGMIATIRTGMKWLKISTKLPRKELLNVINFGDSIYTISPTLFPRPKEWPDNLQVLGFHQKTSHFDWQPDYELTSFLDSHSKILFVSFGSMINPAPKRNTEIILEVLEKHHIPAIINTAAGGLEAPTNYNTSLFHFVPTVPYDWIFPKVYAVMHHGGSGTTHLGLKNGCPTLIIPHIIDQFAWNRINNELGTGPRGPKIGKLSMKTLEPLVIGLMNNSAYKERATELASEMGKEDYGDKLVSSITS